MLFMGFGYLGDGFRYIDNGIRCLGKRFGYLDDGLRCVDVLKMDLDILIMDLEI